jgi:hypothetical protein
MLDHRLDETLCENRNPVSLVSCRSVLGMVLLSLELELKVARMHRPRVTAWSSASEAMHVTRRVYAQAYEALLVFNRGTFTSATRETLV